MTLTEFPGTKEAAKRAVEIAIEDSEAATLEFLHQQGNAAGQAEPGAA